MRTCPLFIYVGPTVVEWYAHRICGSADRQHICVAIMSATLCPKGYLIELSYQCQKLYYYYLL